MHYWWKITGKSHPPGSEWNVGLTRKMCLNRRWGHCLILNWVPAPPSSLWQWAFQPHRILRNSEQKTNWHGMKSHLCVYRLFPYYSCGCAEFYTTDSFLTPKKKTFWKLLNPEIYSICKGFCMSEPDKNISTASQWNILKSFFPHSGTEIYF